MQHCAEEFAPIRLPYHNLTHKYKSLHKYKYLSTASEWMGGAEAMVHRGVTQGLTL